jgi:hypothetical protein
VRLVCPSGFLGCGAIWRALAVCEKTLGGPRSEALTVADKVVTTGDKRTLERGPPDWHQSGGRSCSRI